MSRDTDRRSPGTPVVRPWPLSRYHVTLAVVVLVGLALLATLSLLFDARLETGARALPPDAVAWGRAMSALAKSPPLYTISAVLTLGPLLLRRVGWFRAQADTLTTVAERAGYILATLAASSLAAQAIKHTVGRARPVFFATLGPYHFDGFSTSDGFASFPSGHSTTAFAMATALSLLFPSLRVALFTLAATIAASRVVVQAHYFSDIAAGAVLGFESAFAVAAVFTRCHLTFTRHGPDIGLKPCEPARVRP